MDRVFDSGPTNVLSQVHPHLRNPLNALGLATLIMCLIQLINLASTTALVAILSLSTLALYVSYIMPTTFFLIRKLQGDSIPYAAFQLGRWGIPINIFAIGYCIYIAIFLPFPSEQPVTWANMNYGGPVLLAVILFALCDWFLSGRKRFQVPTAKHGSY